MSDDDLLSVMEQVAKDLAGSVGPEETLQRITASATRSISQVHHSSITVLTGDGDLLSLAATSDLASRADRLQFTEQQGPCFEAVIADRRVVSTDLANDARWPSYGPKAASLGLLSQAAIIIESDGNHTGLNLYSESVGAFEPLDDVAELFGAHAAAALGRAREVHQLLQTIDTRTLIGQATGIVMERYRMGPLRAFELLTQLSGESNVGIHTIAERMVRDAAESPGQAD